MLSVAEETGNYIEATPDNIIYYREQMALLTQNREEQKNIIDALKSETQFNIQVQLSGNLKRLQDVEKIINGSLHY
jgi:phosphoenolpyruvate-protein kinase (PTS system EI component)